MPEGSGQGMWDVGFRVKGIVGFWAEGLECKTQGFGLRVA